jgi:hypothetical protein
MSKNNSDRRQELNSFTNNPSPLGNSHQRSVDYGHQTSKTSRKIPQGFENKLEVVERLIKFLSAEC